ncbi:MAG: energy-coupling factor transporter ATPase, partial [Chloroflexota bacterium]|nr:energy-coupling factor transporter ATPase [Chloroflexota bacterium]
LALHEQGVTLAIISHNMEELAALCNRLYVIATGRTVMAGTPGEIFGQPVRLRELGLDVPPVTAVIDALVRAGVVEPGPTVYTLAQAVALLQDALQRRFMA